jgi:hypothetical protein
MGPGAVATDAELNKRWKYSSLDPVLYLFQPVAVETFGANGQEAWGFHYRTRSKINSYSKGHQSSILFGSVIERK